MAGLDTIWVNVLKDEVKPGKSLNPKDAVQTAYDKDNTKLVDKLLNKCPDDLKNKPLFSKDVLNKLARSHLTAIADMVSKIDSSKGLPTTRVTLVKALDEQSKYFVKYAELGEFGQEKFNSLSNTLDSGDPIDTSDPNNIPKGKPSKADLELVEAFNMIGLKLTRSGSKWVIPEENNKIVYENRGIKIPATDNYFRFEDKQVRNLVENYLNQPEKRNGKVITPDGIFQVYRDVATNQTNTRTDIDKKQKNLFAVEIATSKTKFSTNSPDWEVGLLTNDALIQLTARKVALSQVFEEQFEDIKDADGKFSEDLNNEFLNDDMIKKDKRYYDKLAKLQSSSIDALDFINNYATHAISDPTKVYDDKIKVLEGTKTAQNESKADEQIAQLKIAKTQLEYNIAYQKSYLDKFLSQHTFKDSNAADVKKAMLQGAQGASKYTIVMENGKPVFAGEQPGKGLPTDAKNDMDKYLQASTENVVEHDEEDVEQVDLETLIGETYPDIFEHFYAGMMDRTNETGGNQTFQNAMQEATMFNIATECLRRDGALYNLYHEWEGSQKKEGKDSSFANWSKVYTTTPPLPKMFTEEMLNMAHQEALTRDGVQNDKINDEYQQKINNINNTFNKYVVLLDFATQEMSEEEHIKYLDPSTPNDVKQKLINSKIDAAYERLKKGASANDVNNALKRNKNNILAKLVENELSAGGIRAGEQESGVEPKNSITKTLDKYITALDKEQNLNDEKLRADKQKTVDVNNGRAENLKENEEIKKEDWPTYSQKYPTPPDNETFMKKMKPYCKKEIVKNFLKPLLEALRKTRINPNVSKPSFGNSNPSSASEAHDSTIDTNLDENEEEETNDSGDGSGTPTDSKDNSNPTNNANSTDVKSKTIMKRDFEASLFMPGEILVQGALGENFAKFRNEKKHLDNLKSTNKITEEEYNKRYKELNAQLDNANVNLKDLEFVMSCLCTVNDGAKINKHNLVVGDRDMRDDLRQVAFDIGGGKIKGEEVDKKLDEIFVKYDFEKRKGPGAKDDIAKMKAGFKHVTPALLDTIFESTSQKYESQDSNNKTKYVIKVGEKLMKSEDLLNKLKDCKDDNERYKIMTKFYGPEWIKNNSQLLDYVIKDSQAEVSKGKLDDYGDRKYESAYESPAAEADNEEMENSL